MKNYINYIKEYFDTYAQPDYFETRSKCVDYGACLMPEWEKTLTEEEKYTINWYRDSGYQEVNNYLNTGKADNKIKERTKIIINSLNRIELSDDITTYKGVMKNIYGINPLYVYLNDITEKEIGEEISFKSLMSTTLHFQYSINAFGGIIMKFELKKGVNAAYISFAHPEDGSRAENEILIHPSTKYLLKNVEMIKNGVKQYEKEYKLITLSSI